MAGGSRPGARARGAGIPTPKPGSSLAACLHRGCAWPPVSPVMGLLPHCTKRLWGPRQPHRALSALPQPVAVFTPIPSHACCPQLCSFNWRRGAPCHMGACPVDDTASLQPLSPEATVRPPLLPVPLRSEAAAACSWRE